MSYEFPTGNVAGPASGGSGLDVHASRSGLCAIFMSDSWLCLRERRLRKLCCNNIWDLCSEDPVGRWVWRCHAGGTATGQPTGGHAAVHGPQHVARPPRKAQQRATPALHVSSSAWFLRSCSGECLARHLAMPPCVHGLEAAHAAWSAVRAVASPGVAATGCSAAHALRLPGPGQALTNAEAHLHHIMTPAAARLSLGTCRQKLSLALSAAAGQRLWPWARAAAGAARPRADTHMGSPPAVDADCRPQAHAAAGQPGRVQPVVSSPSLTS